MDTHSLQAFIEVARTQSFSSAADKLFITQPAVSKRIANLETQLGVRLFDRIGKKVNLTEAGNALLPKAQAMMLGVEDMKRLASNLDGKIGGTLSMAISHHIGLHRLPPVLKQFTREYPAVKLDISFMDSEVACRAVETGDIELAIVTLPDQVHGLLSVTEVWVDHLVVVAAREHELVNHEKISLSDLSHYPAVLPGAATYTRSIIDLALSKQNLELQIALTTNYLETLKMLCSTGIGWSLLPHTMLDHELVQLPVKEIQLSRSLGTVIHKERTLSNGAQKMIKLCHLEG